MHIQFDSKKFLLFFCTLFLLSTSINAQNVGIGTNKPLVPLHIKASDEALRIQGTYPWIGFTDNTADSTTYDGFLYFPDTSMVLGSRAGTNMPIILAPNNTGVVYVTSANNVGISTASPTQKLDVNGTVRIRGGNPVKGAVLTSDSIGNASWQLAPGGVLVDTITVPSANWIWNSQYSLQTSPGSYTEYFTRYVDVPISQLTQSFLSGAGTVQVYFTPNTLANPNMWLPTPYYFLDGSYDFNYVVAFQTYPGIVELDYFFQQVIPNSTIPTLSNYTIPVYTFKIVLTQGTMIN